MARPRILVLIALVVIALGVGLWVLIRRTDESRIQGQLSRLAAAVRITDADAQDNPVGRLAHVSDELQPLFEPDVRMSIPEVPSLHVGRQELVGVVAGAPRFVRSFDVDFTGVTIKVDDTRTTALVGATARVKILERDGVVSQDKRVVDLRFVRKNDEWVIRTLTVWSPEDAAPP
jgi:hypothetical protein